MNCACPKCDATVELNESEIPQAGSSHQCPECKEKYWTYREEFLLRAFKKKGRLYCFNCGQELGHEMLCLGCGTLCPDYSVVQSDKPVARKQQKSSSRVSVPRRHKTAAKTSVKQAVSQRETQRAPGQKANRSVLIYVAVAVLILALAGGLTSLYLDYKAEQEYANTFIVALYGIQSGTDMSKGMLSTLSARWQDANGIQSAVAPRLSETDLDKLQAVKVRVTMALNKLDESPDKFARAKENLVGLYNVYEKISELNSSAPGSFNDFTDAVRQLETDYAKAAGALKSAMPEELLNELNLASVKYRNLRYLTEGK